MSEIEVRTMWAPGKYIQGQNVLPSLGVYVRFLGESALIISDSRVYNLVGKAISEALEARKIRYGWTEFGGECCFEEIERISRQAKKGRSEVIIGVGGGKTLDTAKAVAVNRKVPMAMVPTIAATDAPTSSISIVYSKEGVFEKVLSHSRNPELIVVDVGVIAKAPVRFLVSGMGDALATWFEADATFSSDSDNEVGGKPTRAAHILAKLCFEILMKHALAAKLAVEKERVIPAVDLIIEANILLSGLGFESGGLAAAHAIHNGLTVLEETHNYLHGEKVAVGTVTQLFLESKDKSIINQVLTFCDQLRLPMSLADIGLAALSPSRLMEVAEVACRAEESIHNEPFDVTPKMVSDALLAADVYLREFRAQQQSTSFSPKPM